MTALATGVAFVTPVTIRAVAGEMTGFAAVVADSSSRATIRALGFTTGVLHAETATVEFGSIQLSDSITGISVVLEFDEGVISVILDRNITDWSVFSKQLVEITRTSAV